jgi:hypothetical protein
MADRRGLQTASETTEVRIDVPNPYAHLRGGSLRHGDGADLRDETAAERSARRRQLHRLDGCLDVLETAMEKDRRVVGARDAEILAETTLMLCEGMALPDAIDVVLLLQEAYMRPVFWPASSRGIARHG